MRAALANQVATAIAGHVFDQVEVRPVGGSAAWLTVSGSVKRGATVEQFNGFATQTIVGADEVHLLAADWPEDDKPATDWWVRELAGRNAGRVMRLAEPARVATKSGSFLVAPLKPNHEPVPQ